MAVDATTYWLLAYPLPLLAGLAITFAVLWKTKRTPLLLVATAVLLYFLFGPLSLAGAAFGAAAWLALRAKTRKRTH